MYKFIPNLRLFICAGQILCTILDNTIRSLVSQYLLINAHTGDPITFDDIAGLSLAKAAMFEAVVLPKINPAMFNSGLTRSSRGVLLFGPPGECAVSVRINCGSKRLNMCVWCCYCCRCCYS